MAKKSTITVRIIGDEKKFADALGRAETGVSNFAGKIGGLLKIGAAAGVAAAGAALAKGFTDALGAQANDDLIAARLGISDAEAERLGDIAGRVYGEAWGDSLGGVTDTVTAIATSFDNIDDGQLEALTGRAEALAQVFGTDVSAGVQTASELVSSGLADSADQAFDLLTRGLQEMPQGIRDELFAASNEYGDFFADLGFSGDETFAALTRYAEDGIYGIDKFGDSLKELSIRGADMSTASVAAYEAAGLSAEAMADRFLAGGDQAREAVEITAAGLLTIQDPVERANAAIALFGTPLEDLSVTEIPDFLAGLTDMTGGLGDVEGAAQTMADTVGGNTLTKFEAFRRKALLKLADFAEKKLIPAFETAVAWFEDNWPQIQAEIQRFVDWLQINAWPVVQTIFNAVVAIMGEVKAWVDENWPQIQAVISGVMTTIGDIISTVLTAAQIAWEYFGDNIVSFLQGIVGPITQIIEGVVAVIQGLVDFVVGVFTGDWGRAWEGIQSIFTGTVDAVIGYARYLWELLKFYVTTAVDAVRLVWDFSFLSEVVGGAVDSVVGFFTGLPGRLLDLVADVASAAADIGAAIKDGIIDGFSAAAGFAGDLVAGLWDALKGLLNTQLIDRINDAIPNSLGVGPFSVDLPDNPIPRFHGGGLVGDLYGPAREVPALLQTGEFVLSRSDVDKILRGGGRQGPLIGNVYVVDGRDLNRELARAQALAAASF